MIDFQILIFYACLGPSNFFTFPQNQVEQMLKKITILAGIKVSLRSIEKWWVLRTPLTGQDLQAPFLKRSLKQPGIIVTSGDAHHT